MEDTKEISKHMGDNLIRVDTNRAFYIAAGAPRYTPWAASRYSSEDLEMILGYGASL